MPLKYNKITKFLLESGVKTNIITLLYATILVLLL
jgi:hypothetical protein